MPIAGVAEQARHYVGRRCDWFRARGLNKPFIACAGGMHLLWPPTTRGHDLLLQPQSP